MISNNNINSNRFSLGSLFTLLFLGGPAHGVMTITIIIIILIFRVTHTLSEPSFDPKTLVFQSSSNVLI